MGDSCNTYPTCARGVRPHNVYGKGEAYAGFTDQIAGPGPLRNIWRTKTLNTESGYFKSQNANER